MLIVTTEEWKMSQTPKRAGEKIVKDIKRAPRKHYSSEEKIRKITESIRQSVHIYNCEMKHPNA